MEAYASSYKRVDMICMIQLLGVYVEERIGPLPLCGAGLLPVVLVHPV